MLFNTFQFVWMFPIIFLIYYGVALKFNFRKAGNTVLLIVSYGLYLKWKPIYALVLLWVTAITYVGARFVSHKNEQKCKYNITILTIVLLLALIPLFIFKYYNFVNATLSSIIALIGVNAGIPGINWVMPLGLSFFTLQSIGYVVDVYRKRVPVENNWWDYMLFVSFFPQIASGPISKASDLLPQIKKERSFDYVKAVEGLKCLLLGMFMKVVLADRLGVFVDSVYNNIEYQSGLSCLLASVFYSMQIYGDFAGYSFMAVGVGKLLGFDLINNFERPYLSQSITEFWHRWHKSLSIWLKDYIYIPLGGSRCGKLRNYWNIFITFLVSGLWHGANWTFIFWGIIHGLVQIIEKFLGLQKPSTKGPFRIVRIVMTFVIATIAWIFFRMPTFNDALLVCGKILTFNGIAIKGLTSEMIIFMIFAITIVVIRDLNNEFHFMKVRSRIAHWSVWVLLFISILSCGVFDSSQFIYVSF